MVQVRGTGAEGNLGPWNGTAPGLWASSSRSRLRRRRSSPILRASASTTSRAATSAKPPQLDADGAIRGTRYTLKATATKRSRTPVLVTVEAQRGDRSPTRVDHVRTPQRLPWARPGRHPSAGLWRRPPGPRESGSGRYRWMACADLLRDFGMWTGWAFSHGRACPFGEQPTCGNSAALPWPPPGKLPKGLELLER